MKGRGNRVAGAEGAIRLALDTASLHLQLQTVGIIPGQQFRGQASTAARALEPLRTSADRLPVILSQNGPSRTISTCPGRRSRNHDFGHT